MEENLLQNYFDTSTAIYGIIQDMQKGITIFDTGLVAKANSEVQDKSKILDASTYKFAQDLSKAIYGEKTTRRIIMFVEGTFYGSKELETIIPIDLGNNPHQLFKTHPGHPTVDSAVTFQETIRFLRENRSSLYDAGFEVFGVGKSRFFYFKESDLADKNHLYGNGKVKMAGLVPLIVPTKGHVILDEVKDPSLDHYMQFAPPNVSYRFKKSLMDKLLERYIFSKTSEDDVRLIADWVAHRPVVETREDVENLEHRLMRSSKIGKNSSINWLYTPDYYSEKPKKTSSRDFKAKNVVVDITINGFQDSSLREIQIVDKEQYFINEISKDSQKTREEYDEGRRHIPKKKVESYYELRSVLENIFFVENEVIPIPRN